MTTDVLASNTVCPEKYTDPKGARLFCLLPVYSFQLRHIQFDERTFLPLLRKADLFKRAKIKQEQLQRIIFQNFDFQKIGVQDEVSFEPEQVIVLVITIRYQSNCITSFFIADSLGFRNVLRTDGTDLEFMFKKLKYPRSSDVATMDFVGWLSDNHRITI